MAEARGMVKTSEIVCILYSLLKTLKPMSKPAFGSEEDMCRRLVNVKESCRL